MLYFSYRRNCVRFCWSICSYLTGETIISLAFKDASLLEYTLRFLTIVVRTQWRSQPKMFGPASSADGASFVGGYGGILPRKILKTRTSEMPFPAI